jgi:anti-sigma factor RsiW
MTCDDIQSRLHDFVRRRLDPATQADVGAHVDACAACASAAEAEQALDELLHDRLPRYEAPTALQRRLGLLMGRPGTATRPTRRWSRLVAPAMAAGVALFALGVVLQRGGTGRDGELGRLASEAVNDHLRVLASQHPVDVESGGTHQVKPWFEGKLDFAPVVPALEETDVHLRGGAVGYVFDRKAAVLVYQLRLHMVTLLVFRADGLAWPEAGGRQIGTARVHEQSIRGFNAFLWRDDGLGYALVSDVSAKELSALAARVVAETVPSPGR